MKKMLLYACLLFTTTTYAQTEAGEAKLNEGMEYFYGISRQYDPGKAFNDFKQSAEEGNSKAMNFIANMYASGLVVEQNTRIAIAWFEKAGNAGNTMAYNNLANLYRHGELVSQDFAKAADYYKKSSALGDAWAKNSLAYFYFKGLGVLQNYNSAFAIYKDLAYNSDDVNAWYFLGLCYRNGYGTNANKNEAIKWLQKAADRGDEQAKYELTVKTSPENSSVLSSDLQNKVTSLKSHVEKFVAHNTNDISGSYQGSAVYYDFSNRFINKIVPLKLDLKRTEAGYEGTWTEADTVVANIRGSYKNNDFVFDSASQYSRYDYYSYSTLDKYKFDNVPLTMKYFSDSVYLTGKMQFYSITRKEPGQPMYIVLQRKATVSDGIKETNDIPFALSPNPANAFIRVNFSIDRMTKVQLQINGLDGKILTQSNNENLLKGNYSYSFDVSKLAAGTYLLKMQADNTIQTKKFIKL